MEAEFRNFLLRVLNILEPPIQAQCLGRGLETLADEENSDAAQ
jgi:hypothetical protein